MVTPWCYLKHLNKLQGPNSKSNYLGHNLSYHPAGIHFNDRFTKFLSSAVGRYQLLGIFFRSLWSKKAQFVSVLNKNTSIYVIHFENTLSSQYFIGRFRFYLKKWRRLPNFQILRINFIRFEYFCIAFATKLTKEYNKKCLSTLTVLS